MRYAGLKVLGAVCAGILIGTGLQLPLWLYLIPILLGIILARPSQGWTFYLSLIALAALNYELCEPKLPESLYGLKLGYEGVVVEAPAGSQYPQYTVAVDRVETQRSIYRLDLRIFLETGMPLKYGDRVGFRTSLKPLSYPKNPYGFDFERYYERRGIVGRAQPREVAKLGQGEGYLWMRLFIIPLRDHFFSVIERWLKSDEAGLLSGMLLGERARLSPQARKAFSDAGVMHVLAVSGLHVGIVVSILWLIFKVLRFPSWLSLPILLISIFLYSGIAQFRPSVVRAGMMCGLAGIGMIFERRVNPLNSVLAAGTLILLISPQALWDSSFQLSFAATLGILLFYPRLDNFFSSFNPPGLCRRGLLAPMSVSISAQLGVAPLILYHFLKLPLLSVFANLLIVPLVGLAIPLGFLLMIVDPISTLIASWIAEATWGVTSLILLLTRWFSGLSGLITPGRGSFWLMVFFWGCAFFIAYLSKPWARRLLTYWVILGFNAIVWTNLLKSEEFEVLFLDVGRGEASIYNYSGKTRVVLAGSPRLQPITDYLHGRGIGTVELLYLSEPDPSLLETLEEEFRIKSLLVKPQAIGLRTKYQDFSLLELSTPALMPSWVLKLPYASGIDLKQLLGGSPNAIIFTRRAVPERKLSELKAQGVEVFSTRNHGAVTVRTDGKMVTIRTQRSGEPLQFPISPFCHSE